MEMENGREKERGRYSYQRHGKQLAKRSRSWWDQRPLSLLLPWPWLPRASLPTYLLRLYKIMRRLSQSLLSLSLTVSRFVPCVGITRRQDLAWRIYAHDDAFDVRWREWSNVSERMCILWFSTHSIGTIPLVGFSFSFPQLHTKIHGTCDASLLVYR